MPSRSGRSSMRRLRVVTTREPSDASTRTGDNAQAVAERAAGRQPQQLGRDHRPGDAEQPRDILRRAVDAGAVVLDEVAAIGQSPTLTLAPVSSPLSASSFSTRRRSLSGGDAGLLLQALDGAEQVQSARSNFKFWAAFGLVNRRSDFQNRKWSSPLARRLHATGAAIKTALAISVAGAVAFHTALTTAIRRFDLISFVPGAERDHVIGGEVEFLSRYNSVGPDPGLPRIDDLKPTTIIGRAHVPA